MTTRAVNFFSVDLEDWHQCYAVRYNSPDMSSSGGIEKQVDSLLAVLDDSSVRATFFCLARLAEERPALIRKVAGQEHEIQSHGYSHKKVDTLSPAEFRADLERSKGILEDIAGTEVIGYRAPEFSVNASCRWAFDVLQECGYSYDSSVFPLKMRRYGWRGFPKVPVSVALANGGRIIEFPIFTADFFHASIPLGGGGYFRLFPRPLVSSLIRKNRRQHGTFYFHPYELCESFLNVGECATNLSRVARLRTNISQNLFRRTMPRKISELLVSFRFMTLGAYLEQHDPESSIVLS